MIHRHEFIDREPQFSTKSHSHQTCYALRQWCCVMIQRAAWIIRSPPPGFVFHSVRGRQYCSHEYLTDE
jgi:hypothetical protein